MVEGEPLRFVARNGILSSMISSRMKFWIPIVLTIFLFGCSVVPTQLPGNSLTNGARPLRIQAWMGVGGYENTLNPKSGRPNVIGTRVVEPPTSVTRERSTGMEMMKWTELWTIKRPGSNVLYRLEFEVKGSQGEFVTVIYAGAATNQSGMPPGR